MKPRIGVVVSVRTNSKRLPAKAFLPVSGKASFLFLLDRMKNGLEFPLHVATTDHWTDDYLTSDLKKLGFSVYRGDEDNVFKRLLTLSQIEAYEYIVRITADCPLLSADLVNDLIIQAFAKKNWVLATTKGMHPAGIDIEILSVTEMKNVEENLTVYDQEHVTSYFYSHLSSDKVIHLKHPRLNIPDGKYLLDTIEDFLFLNEFMKTRDSFFSLLLE